ncbi:hypothetical protein Q5752_006101 [Cryptotrichosporon argae]
MTAQTTIAEQSKDFATSLNRLKPSTHDAPLADTLPTRPELFTQLCEKVQAVKTELDKWVDNFATFRAKPGVSDADNACLRVIEDGARTLGAGLGTSATDYARQANEIAADEWDLEEARRIVSFYNDYVVKPTNKVLDTEVDVCSCLAELSHLVQVTRGFSTKERQWVLFTDRTEQKLRRSLQQRPLSRDLRGTLGRIRSDIMEDLSDVVEDLSDIVDPETKLSRLRNILMKLDSASYLK